jgi:predicted nuclease with TOPRIM domain
MQSISVNFIGITIINVIFALSKHENKFVNMENKNSGKSIVIVLAVLLVAAIAYALYANVQHAEIQAELETEKTAIQTELTSMIAQYDAKLVENTSLSDELTAARADIISYRDSLSSEKKTNYKLIRRYKNKVYKLQQQNKELFAQLEALSLENTKLNGELVVANETIVTQTAANDELISENKDLTSKVAIAAVLTGDDLTAVSMKKLGSGALKETNRYKKTTTVQISMIIDANEIAASGEKQVYFVIKDASGTVVASKGTFNAGGTDVSYSDVATVNYQNKETDVVFDVAVEKGTLSKGTYTVAAYLDANVLGTTTLTLKESFLGIF